MMIASFPSWKLELELAKNGRGDGPNNNLFPRFQKLRRPRRFSPLRVCFDNIKRFKTQEQQHPEAINNSLCQHGAAKVMSRIY